MDAYGSLFSLQGAAGQARRHSSLAIEAAAITEYFVRRESAGQAPFR
jgi:hypothetical protein